MLSRWNMSERSSKNHGLLQVQYAFLELPKMPNKQPTSPGAELWAWLFELIRSEAEVEMIILFGSFARGDWVDPSERRRSPLLTPRFGSAAHDRERLTPAPSVSAL